MHALVEDSNDDENEGGDCGILIFSYEYSLECENSLRAFAYLTRNISLGSIRLSRAEYKSKSMLG